MWPQKLQMTREECRGVLRRLELESYSHVISVFRAQGGLNENKAKLLEELRSTFHISLERHRAEARRVSNDEELCTIAEIISGPNTWQEWAREGRRNFPMLPRVAPQTALNLISNKVGEETVKQNAKLPYPAETAQMQLDQNMELEMRALGMSYKHENGASTVVVADPFKMPEIPTTHKKNIKRNHSEAMAYSGQNYKRSISEIIAPNLYNVQTQQKQYAHMNNNMEKQQQSITIGNNNNNNGSSTRKLTQQEKQLEQQRYFYHQQLKIKRCNTNTGKRHNSNVASSKNVRKSQKQKQKHQQQQQQFKHKQMERLKSVTQQQIKQTGATVQNIYNNNNNNNNSNNIAGSVLVDNMQQQQQQQFHLQLSEQEQQQISTALSPASQPMSHMIATKKELNKNLAKLQIPASLTTSATSMNLLLRLPPTGTTGATTPPPQITTTTANASLTNVPTIETNVAIPTSPTPRIIDQKQLLLTPVQKYIVEDRLPPIAVTGAQTTTPAVNTTPQIMTLPQINTASNKLRAINTTILPPGIKLQPAPAKRVLTANAVSGLNVITETVGQQQQQHQQQVFNIIGNAEAGSNLTLPTHAPPAIMNIHGVTLGSGSQGHEVNTITSSSGSTFALPTQSKVLTTKLVPIVLNSNTCNNNNNTNSVGSSAATLVTGGVNTVTNTATIIKNLSPGVLLTSNTTPNSTTIGSNTYISTLSSGTQVFRKPNILSRKGPPTTITGSSTAIKPLTINTSSTVASAILSNYKMSTQASGTGVVSTTSMVPIRRMVVPASTSNASSLRPTYKIAPSSNGKVIIQATNSGHKLQAPLTTALTNQRVPLQKVQIIPAPGGTFPLQQPQTSQPRTTTLMVNNKASNMLFLPTNKNRTGMTHLSLGRTATSNLQQLGQKQNLVVISSSSSTILPQTQYKLLTTNANYLDATTNSNNNNNNNKNNNNSNQIITLNSNNQLITEDTPLDILNMPIIVENSGEQLISESNVSTPMTITNIITTTQRPTTQLQKQQQLQQQTANVILGATDWEMELDQAAVRTARIRRAYSVCTPAPQYNRNQPFVLPRQLGRTLQTPVDTSGLLGGALNNLRTISNSHSLPSNQTVGSTSTNTSEVAASTIVIDDAAQINNVIVIKQDGALNNNNNNNTNNNNNNNNNNNKNKINITKHIVLMDATTNEHTNKEIETNTGTINVSEGGCIPMDLETETIVTTTIIPNAATSLLEATTTTTSATTTVPTTTITTKTINNSTELSTMPTTTYTEEKDNLYENTSDFDNIVQQNQVQSVDENNIKNDESNTEIDVKKSNDTKEQSLAKSEMDYIDNEMVLIAEDADMNEDFKIVSTIAHSISCNEQSTTTTSATEITELTTQEITNV